MRLDLNLASQPYRDVRRFLTVWTVILTALAVLTAVLVYAAGAAVVNWRKDVRDENQLRAKIGQLDQQRATVQAMLARSDNRQVRDRSQFLNELIGRKAFSWTQVMSDLEELMPNGLRVVSIKPRVNDDNQLALDISVEGPSRDRAIDFVRRLEGSSHFAAPEVRSEGTGRGGERTQRPGQQQPEVVEFVISAVYVPQFLRDQAAQNRAAEAR